MNIRRRLTALENLLTDSPIPAAPDRARIEAFRVAALEQDEMIEAHRAALLAKGQGDPRAAELAAAASEQFETWAIKAGYGDILDA